jgi:hypothetical protein
MSLFRKIPFRCRKCGGRFYRDRTVVAEESVEVPTTPAVPH